MQAFEVCRPTYLRLAMGALTQEWRSRFHQMPSAVVARSECAWKFCVADLSFQGQNSFEDHDQEHARGTRALLASHLKDAGELATARQVCKLSTSAGINRIHHSFMYLHEYRLCAAWAAVPQRKVSVR